MYEPTMTLEERERLAYIQGRTADAAMLARAIEGDDELQAEVNRLDDERKNEERRADGEYFRAEAAEERAADLEQKVDDLQAEVAELRREIHDKSLDLV